MGVSVGGSRAGRVATWVRRDTVDPPAALADPYLEWARATDHRYLAETGRHERIALIIELSGMNAREFATGEWNPPAGWERWLRVPTLYSNPASGLERASYCTATVSAEFFSRLRSHASLRRAVQRIGLGGAAAEPAPWVKPAASPRPQGTAKRGHVVTGIIDDGLAFAHERFRRRGKTRIEYLWRQDGPPVPAAGPGYGAELCKQGSGGIDDAIVRCTHAGVLDEDELYRLLGHIDFRHGGHQAPAMRAAHGTHVMDLAAGCDEQSAPDTRPVIGVQLPLATTADTSGATLAGYVLDGLHYILDRADAVALRHNSGPLPAVVNLSYGLIAGPHDGSSILEAAIDQLIELRNERAPFAVVLPSGNSRHARCHASFRLGNKGDEQRLDWRVLPDDTTPSYMEIWLRHTAGSIAPRLAIQVTPPGGDASPWINEGDTYTWQHGDRVLCEAIYSDKAPGSRSRVLIALAETSRREPEPAVAPAGTWQVRVRNAGPAATIDAWIQRDDTPYGYPQRGRQSRFEDVAYEYVDDAGRLIEEDSPESYVRRDGTINSLATGANTLVIGGYRRSDGKLAVYSAGGPVVPSLGGVPRRAGPDAVAPSEDSVACRGVLAAGTRSGSTVAINGTSVAAPQISRWIADRMAAGEPFDRNALCAIARKPVPASAEREGCGRIDCAPVSGVSRLGER
jgi:Subtilase family